MAESKTLQRRKSRARRHARVLRRVRGTAARPRLVVYRSLKNIEGQVVDDDRGVTLVGVSTRSPGVEPAEDAETSRKAAESFAAGRLLAKRALDRGIEKVVFDRGGFRYHGRVKAFADGARDGGLDF